MLIFLNCSNDSGAGGF